MPSADIGKGHPSIFILSFIEDYFKEEICPEMIMM